MIIIFSIIFGKFTNWLSKTNFVSFHFLPAFYLLAFKHQHYCRPQIEISHFFSFLEILVLMHHYSSDIQGTHHNHSQVKFLSIYLIAPMKNNSPIFFINFFPFYQGLLTDT